MSSEFLVSVIIRPILPPYFLFHVVFNTNTDLGNKYLDIPSTDQELVGILGVILHALLGIRFSCQTFVGVQIASMVVPPPPLSDICLIHSKNTSGRLHWM